MWGCKTHFRAKISTYLFFLASYLLDRYKDWSYFKYQIGHFRYIKIQLDSAAQRARTKERNKHDYSFSFVCASQPHCQAEFLYIEKNLLTRLTWRTLHAHAKARSSQTLMLQSMPISPVVFSLSHSPQMRAMIPTETSTWVVF